ncbi:hypothetical protein UPYG_G00082070 [Umbra pygmaea]|uniref:Uncharacterized protein n=1 Tax=Umbra pygmaea TaxID=75934 RepID=A0ABD0XYD8_UMBPY
MRDQGTLHLRPEFILPSALGRRGSAFRSGLAVGVGVVVISGLAGTETQRESLGDKIEFYSVSTHLSVPLCFSVHRALFPRSPPPSGTEILSWRAVGPNFGQGDRDGDLCLQDSPSTYRRFQRVRLHSKVHGKRPG